MKNYLTRKGEEGGMDFWDDPFDYFFKPVYYSPKKGLMKTDIKETDKDYELAVEMPGFDKKDINVTLKNGYLNIEAKREDKQEDNKHYVKRERSYSCSRSYYVGEHVSEKDVKAKNENGVLSLVVPKEQEKQIPSGNIEIE